MIYLRFPVCQPLIASKSIAPGAGAKIYSVVMDILRATASVTRFNEGLRGRYYVS